MRPDGRRRTARAGGLLAALCLSATMVTGCSDKPESTEAYCKQAKKVPPLAEVIAGYSDADPEELETRLGSARTAYADLEKAAPDSIKDQVGAVVDMVDVIIDAVAAHPNDPSTVAQIVGSAARRNRRAIGATEKLYSYTEETCHVDLDPGGSGSSGSTPTTGKTPTSTTTTTTP